MFRWTVAGALRSGRLAVVALLLVCAGCAADSVLADYTRHAGTAFTNAPADYVSWLKRNRFTRGELDDLPPYALIVHHTRSEALLEALGYSAAEFETIRTGYTDPNVLTVVRPQEGPPFIVNEGMPGGSGISTQAAELGALGVEYVVHIGTCGILGDTMPFERLIVSAGSYKDGAAYLLSADRAEAETPIAYPDPDLSAELARAAADLHLPHLRAVGFTVPLYYLQPSGLVRALVARAAEGGDEAARFVEMEQAAFFMMARRMDMKAASIVVGSDRAVVTPDELEQLFYDGDTDLWMRAAIEASLLAFARVEAMQDTRSP